MNIVVRRRGKIRRYSGTKRRNRGLGHQVEKKSKMGPIQVKGKDDVMSNFYECEINQDGKRFRCLEGVYQYRKLKEHGIGERERDPLMAMDGRATKARADALVPKEKDKYRMA
jgi:predicted NAD-dependent protein-ADP-ribosyltransferase YbiA (DUF1768 family)